MCGPKLPLLGGAQHVILFYFLFLIGGKMMTGFERRTFCSNTMLSY